MAADIEPLIDNDDKGSDLYMDQIFYRCTICHFHTWEPMIAHNSETIQYYLHCVSFNRKHVRLSENVYFCPMSNSHILPSMSH